MSDRKEKFSYRLMAIIFGAVAVGLGIASLFVGSWAIVTVDQSVNSTLSSTVGVGPLEVCQTNANTSGDSLGQENCTSIPDLPEERKSVVFIDEVYYLTIAGVGGTGAGFLLLFLAILFDFHALLLVATVVQSLLGLALISAIVLFVLDSYPYDFDIGNVDLSNKNLETGYFLLCASCGLNYASAGMANYLLKLGRE